MQRLKRKYPWLFSFIRNRFKTGAFFGLPFTILLLLTSINLAMLSGLSEQVVHSKQLKAADIQVSSALYNQRVPILSVFFYYFTQLGSIYGITATTILASIFLLLKKRVLQLVALLIAVLGSGLSMHFSKLYFHRDRPFKIVYYITDSSFSFPSGHSTSIMAMVGMLCYFAWLDVKHKTVRLALIIIGTTYIFLIGFSRIYLGVHFVTDVAAGFLLGFLWILLAVGLMEYLTLKQLKQNPNALQ